MARSAPPSWTLFESDGVRRGASKLHGVGTFACRDLAAGELLLVEAGLCAPRGFGALLMTAVLAPSLLVDLHPRSRLDCAGSAREQVLDYLKLATAACNANAFDINCGELEHGPRHYVAQLAVWGTSDSAQKERLVAFGVGDVQSYKFLAASASKFNGAPAAEAVNTTYGFKHAGSGVASIFMVTNRAVRVGEELVVDYGPGYTVEGVTEAQLSIRARVEAGLAGYVAFAKLGRSFPMPPALFEYLHSMQNAAALLPRSSHSTDLMFDMSDEIIEMLHPFALRYRAQDNIHLEDVAEDD
jgi:hypothetical protein